MRVFLSNTNLIELNGLYSEAAKIYINDATVTVTVKDAAGGNVSGPSWPVAMTYVTASDGNYTGILPADLALAAGNIYTAIIDADGGSNRVGHWEVEIEAATRMG